MRIGAAILRAISREPGRDDYSRETEKEASGNELALLRKEFPKFSRLVKGARVVDFGCGAGRQSVALVREEGCYVCGIDSNERSLEKAKQLALDNGLRENDIAFVGRPTREMMHAFDLVISKDAMEHYPDPIAILGEMRNLIHENGKILITFGPPWLAPYGSHMHFFCKVPWLNIIFSEQSVMAVRFLYRNDGARRYEDVESGLNKMTVSKFEKIVAQTGFVIDFMTYSCVKGQSWLSRLPYLRELFINQVSCILAVQSNKASTPIQ